MGRFSANCRSTTVLTVAFSVFTSVAPPCTVIALGGELLAVSVVHRDDSSANDASIGRIKDQAIDIPVGRLPNSGKDEHHEASKGEGYPGKAHTDAPASNGLSHSSVVRTKPR